MIAEIGAAYLCAELGMESTEREDHAAYVAYWLAALKNDKRAIFQAATAAQAASAFFLAQTALRAPACTRRGGTAPPLSPSSSEELRDGKACVTQGMPRWSTY